MHLPAERKQEDERDQRERSIRDGASVNPEGSVPETWRNQRTAGVRSSWVPWEVHDGACSASILMCQEGVPPGLALRKRSPADTLGATVSAQ